MKLEKFIQSRAPKRQFVAFAIACASRVLPALHKQFPDDDAPARAVGAAVSWLYKPTRFRRLAAGIAAHNANASAKTDVWAIDACADTAHCANSTHGYRRAAYAVADYAAHAAKDKTAELKWQAGQFRKFILKSNGK